MNLIEGRVEWCGNGVILIKDRSFSRSLWLFCKYSERHMHSMIKRGISSSKERLTRYSIKIKDVKTSLFVNRLQQRVTSKESTQKDEQALNKLNVPQSRLKKQMDMPLEVQPNIQPVGTLTEIRQYVESESVEINHSDAQKGLQPFLQPVLPALAGFCQDRWLVLVSPPQRPDASALTAAGIDPSRVLLVHAHDTQNNKALNIVEQALQSGNCGAVVAWLEECDAVTLQRLRNAAVAGNAWGVMFRETNNQTASEGIR